MAEKLEEMEMDLDLDSVDLEEVEDNDLDDMDLSDFGEVDDSLDVPHIKVATKTFNEYLKTAKQVASTSGRDVVSKSVSFETVGDTLYCRVTDFDVFLEVKMELLNTEKILDGSFAIPIDILQKLSKATPVNTVIYKDKDTYKMRLAGGDIPLETYTVDVDKFKFQGKVEKETDISSSELYKVMRDFSSIITSAVSPTERRILCESDGAFANYMWAIVSSNTAFSTMDLKIKDLNALKSITKDLDESLEVFRTKASEKVSRKVIQGNKFMYSFLVSDLKVSDVLKDNLKDVVIEDSIYIDFMQLYKMVEVSADLPYSLGKVGLNISEDQDLILTIKTKKGEDSNFKLSGTVNGDPKPLKKEVMLQSKLLRIVLKSFSDNSSVKVSVTDKGIGIESDDYKSAVYTEQLDS